MSIPKIIHQTWKDETIPKRFKHAVTTVKRYHKGWEYKLWTDDDIDRYVKEKHPDFYPIFNNFTRHIMRVDVIRYILLMDIGGVYCDLDYEFIRPFDYSNYDMVFSLERDVNFGDSFSLISNAIMASKPNHPFWHLLFDEMKNNPPKTNHYLDVLGATGPGLLSKHFFLNYQKYNWPRIKLTPKPVFNPYRIRGKNERKLLLNNGITCGIHLGAGTWKERWTLKYIKTKLHRLLTKRAALPQKLDF